MNMFNEEQAKAKHKAALARQRQQKKHDADFSTFMPERSRVLGAPLEDFASIQPDQQPENPPVQAEAASGSATVETPERAHRPVGKKHQPGHHRKVS